MSNTTIDANPHKLPWRVEPAGVPNLSQMLNADGKRVCLAADSIASHIVRCVNAMPAMERLRDAADDLIADYCNQPGPPPSDDTLANIGLISHILDEIAKERK